MPIAATSVAPQTSFIQLLANSNDGKTVAWNDRTLPQKILTIFTLGLYHPSLPEESVAFFDNFLSLLTPDSANQSPSTEKSWSAVYPDKTSVTVRLNETNLEVKVVGNDGGGGETLTYPIGSMAYNNITAHLPLILPDGHSVNLVSVDNDSRNIVDVKGESIFHMLEPMKSLNDSIDAARKISLTAVTFPDGYYKMDLSGLNSDVNRTLVKTKASVTHYVNGKPLSSENLKEIFSSKYDTESDATLAEKLNTKPYNQITQDKIALQVGTWLYNNGYVKESENATLRRAGHALLVSSSQTLGGPLVYFLRNVQKNKDYCHVLSKAVTNFVNSDEWKKYALEHAKPLEKLLNRAKDEKRTHFTDACQNSGRGTQTITLNTNANSASVSISCVAIHLHETCSNKDGMVTGTSFRANYTLSGDNLTANNLSEQIEKGVTFGVARFGCKV